MAQGHTRTETVSAAAMAALMLYWALIAPASILHFVGIQGLHSTLLVLPLAIAFGMATLRKVRIAALLVLASLVLVSLVNTLHWDDARYIAYCLFFACALVLVEISGQQGIDKFCTLATGLINILLGGAILSFILARLGLSPLWTIINPDGQDYYFFYTGFTNSYSDDFIRASAIYDEPGAFSMYICFVAALRHLLNRDRKTTWLMLASGFITFSLAHLAYVFCHFLAEQSSKRRIAVALFLLAFAFLAVVASIGADSNIILLSRLALTDDTNLFAGDNRSFQLLNAWSQISDNLSSIFFGLDSTCVFSQTACQVKFGNMGENPLSPLAFGGLSSEAPYYITVFLFLLSPLFGKRYLVVFGIGILFLQRPYVMGFSYALIAVVMMDLLLRRGREPVGPRSHPTFPRARRPNFNAPPLGPSVLAETAPDAAGKSQDFDQEGTDMSLYDRTRASSLASPHAHSSHGGRRISSWPGTKSRGDGLVTVVTVVYNCAQCIEATILSVVGQSYSGIEYIVVDGGSTDGTLQIIQKHEQEIDYWVSEKDSGIYSAMNKGVGLSTGKWINFMNAGDCFHSNKTVENISKSLDERFAVVAGGVQYIYDPDYRRTRHMRLKFSGFYLEVPHHQASFINNALMKELKYDESFRIRADLNFMTLLHAKGHRFLLVKEVVCDVETNGVSSGLSRVHFSEDVRAGSVVIKHYWLKSSLYHGLYVLPRLMVRKILPKRLESKLRSLITN